MSSEPKHDPFIDYLWRLERKGFATLRRSLSRNPGDDMAALPYVLRFTQSTSWHGEQMHYLVAGLFCLVERPLEPKQQPPEPRQGNFGGSFGRLYRDTEESPSTEQRFIRLLDADAEQLPRRLRQAVTLLKAKDIPIAWEQLLKDLAAWNSENKYVQHRWARAFYHAAAAQETATETTDTSPEEPEVIKGE